MKAAASAIDAEAYRAPRFVCSIVDLATIDAGYAAATEAVALIDRSERGKLALSGPDAVAFLDSLLSNDIAGVEPGARRRRDAADAQGPACSPRCGCSRTEDELLLDTERAALQALFDALSQFRIGYAGELHKRTLQRGLLSLIGPRCGRRAARAPAPAEHAHVATAVAGARCGRSAPTSASTSCA